MQELGKNYQLKVYPNADHGFFGDKRSAYNQLAAEYAWKQLTKFLQKYLAITKN